MKRIWILVIVLSLIVSTAGCGWVFGESFDINSIKSYKDIPGITQEEEDAIEELKAARESFTYGSLTGTEALLMPDGTYAGFTAELCALFSDLFGIKIVQEIYEWDDLKNKLDTQQIDFTSDLSSTPERILVYHMSYTIAQRSQRIFTHVDSPEITQESHLNGLRIGFLEDSADAATVAKFYPDLMYEIVGCSGFDDAANKLSAHEIDVFVTAGVLDPAFEKYGFIRSKNFFPLIFEPVSLTTANPALKPFISVINKYLVAGGIDTLSELYKEGEDDYAKYKLGKSFTEEERAYLEDLKERNAGVNVALMHDAYPASFYNTVEKRYDGAAYDILTEVSKLTDISFNHDCMPIEKPLSDILAKLKTDEVAMMPQLLYSESRKNDYIWSDTSYITTNFALLSRRDYPDIQPFRVYYATVGTIHLSVHEEVFKGLFPDHTNTISFQTANEAFRALERGEIDLLMLAETMLLVQTNYNEKLGYKVNLSFGKTLDTLFGFNKDETILRGIFDKSLAYVDIKGIGEDWLSRTFDYQSKMLRDSIPFIILFGLCLTAALFVVFIFYIKNRKLSKNLEGTVKERTLALEQKTATLSAIYNSIPDLVFSKDVNGVYTSCNPSFEQFAGMTESEITGKRDGDIFQNDREMIEQFMVEDSNALTKRDSQRTERLISYPDGTQRLMETVKAPLIQNDEVVGVMGISRDITERKEMEVKLVEAKELAEQNSKAKSDFLSRMSHEMRTPMNAIIGMTNIGRSSHDIERKDYCLGKIDSASTHLLGVINDVLDISKIEAGKFELSNTDFILEKTLIKITNVINFRMEEKGQSFTIKIGGDVPRAIVSDEQRLSQVITNLLGNAVKFTPDNGSISLFVRRIMGENGCHTLQFEVKDTGIGIPEAQQKNLFTSFEQLDGSVSRKYGGTGLGLAISKHIVEMMGGKIWVTSKVDEGSSFFFDICVQEGQSNAGLPPSDTNLGHLHILAVDGDEAVREFFADYASSLPLQCEVAAGGREACELIDVHGGAYDIVFVDGKMDGMDSLELTKRIKSQNNSNFVIIMTTATEWSQIESEASRAGVDRFVPKPLFSSVLTECILECVNQRLNNAAHNHAEPNQSECFDGIRILLAEDVDVNREITVSLLEPMGISIDCAEDGGVAYRMFMEYPGYDMIFMDIHMPEVDGYTSTKMIRSLPDPRAKTVPIIAMTANVFREDIEKCLAAGMNAHIGKPIDFEDLMAKLRRYLPLASQKR